MVKKLVFVFSLFIVSSSLLSTANAAGGKRPLDSSLERENRILLTPRAPKSAKILLPMYANDAEIIADGLNPADVEVTNLIPERLFENWNDDEE